MLKCVDRRRGCGIFHHQPPDVDTIMPAQFEAFGRTVLYPENWTRAESGDEETAAEDVTLEMPSGGFLTIQRAGQHLSDDEVVRQVRTAIADDYNEVDAVEVDTEDEHITRIVDFQFYYLDLLIVSRLILIRNDSDRLVVQVQSEDRDFERNEPVYRAILKQLAG